MATLGPEAREGSLPHSSHSCSQILPHEDARSSSRPCQTLQETTEGEGKVGLEDSYITYGKLCAQRPQDRLQDEDERGHADHRQSVAIFEGEDQTEPEVYSGFSHHSGKKSAAPSTSTGIATKTFGSHAAICVQAVSGWPGCHHLWRGPGKFASFFSAWSSLALKGWSMPPPRHKWCYCRWLFSILRLILRHLADARMQTSGFADLRSACFPYDSPFSEVLFFRHRHYGRGLCAAVSFVQAFLITMSTLVELTHQTA